jgi:predicted nuclease with TOPRIM domain
MARGWESKAVEEQQAEAARRAEQSNFKPLSPAELARRERLESLRLSQSRLREQLDRARSEAQRQRLASALQQLEAEITQFEQPATQEDSHG